MHMRRQLYFVIAKWLENPKEIPWAEDSLRDAIRAWGFQTHGTRAAALVRTRKKQASLEP